MGKHCSVGIEMARMTITIAIMTMMIHVNNKNTYNHTNKMIHYSFESANHVRDPETECIVLEPFLLRKTVGEEGGRKMKNRLR